MQFLKVEGLGNDFLLLDRRDPEVPGGLAELRSPRAPLGLSSELADLQARAPTLCDRRIGVGGDGLLIVAPPRTPGSRGAMIVVNHDGSRPEMCGNGLRCVALYLAGGPGPVLVDTDAGARACTIGQVAADGAAGEVEVDMGVATQLGPREAAGRRFAAVSVGNPHAVAFVAGEDPEWLARELGPVVERDPRFPGRTNVEFARVDPDGGLTLWVWERGCGITAACGTGACATVAAAVQQGLVAADVPVPVRLPGGTLTVRWSDGRVWMTGPARFVFRGTLAAATGR
jgi:diaminopimelate epimerase